MWTDSHPEAKVFHSQSTQDAGPDDAYDNNGSPKCQLENGSIRRITCFKTNHLSLHFIAKLDEILKVFVLL